MDKTIIFKSSKENMIQCLVIGVLLIVLCVYLTWPFYFDLSRAIQVCLLYLSKMWWVSTVFFVSGMYLSFILFKKGWLRIAGMVGAAACFALLFPACFLIYAWPPNSGATFFFYYIGVLQVVVSSSQLMAIHLLLKLGQDCLVSEEIHRNKIGGEK